MSKKLKYQDTDNPVLLQHSLFLPPGVDAGKDPFPPIGRDKAAVREILANCSEGLGIDLEFNSETGKPSILGVANIRTAAAIPWDRELAFRAVEVTQASGVKLVGHSVISADKPILEGALGITTPLALWDDTMIRHYLCNPDLCKTPSKTEDDSDGASGAMGFMNLWCMGSLYTDLPQWKICRGVACDGPCPLHDPYGYCAIDSWAGLESKFGTAAEMAEKKIPESLHWDLTELAEVCYLMEHRGIKIDRQYVSNLELNFDALKLELFPEDSLFNPKSPKQIQEYFSTYGIELQDTDKKAVKKALEKECKRRGLQIEELNGNTALPPELEALSRLFQFKDAGKGLKSWFDDRYVDKDDLIHPRFIHVGSSMGRLASSRPNFQNIPARGFGSAVRKAIVPRHPGFELLEADFSQLEFRKILHSAGFDLRDLKTDPFVGLVSRSRGEMIPAAKFMFSSQFEEVGAAKAQRQVAKSLIHAYDYLEGIVVLNGKDLQRRAGEIHSGALLVDRDWSYRGGVVGFTGSNLAERLFGDHSYENRKKALALQELVTAEYPMIREFQKKVLREVEDIKGARLPSGRFLPLYGSPADDAKMALAAHGQGGGADFVQGIMLRYKREQPNPYWLFNIQVHDSLVWEIPKEWGPKQVTDHLYLMSQEDPRTPGFFCGFEAKRGPNLGDTKKVEIKL